MKKEIEWQLFPKNMSCPQHEKEKAILWSKTVTLVDGQKLIELIGKYQLHIAPKTTYILDDYYFQEN